MWLARAADIEGVDRKAPPLGLYRSADALTPLSVIPPVTSMRPSYSRTADAPARPTDMSPVGAHVAVGTCGTIARPIRLNETMSAASPAANTVERVRAFAEAPVCFAEPFDTFVECFDVLFMSLAFASVSAVYGPHAFPAKTHVDRSTLPDGPVG